MMIPVLKLDTCPYGCSNCQKEWHNPVTDIRYNAIAPVVIGSVPND
jgi:hypothetical protein